MKKILFTLVMIVLCGFIFSGQAWAGTFDQRQVRQQKRIRNVIKQLDTCRIVSVMVPSVKK